MDLHVLAQAPNFFPNPRVLTPPRIWSDASPAKTRSQTIIPNIRMPESYHCGFCKALISLADVNVAADLALCRACGKTMAFSDIAPIPGSADVDLQRPPKGVRIEDSPIRGRSIIYRKTSPAVLFLIPFTAVWSGGSMYGLYGSQLKEGHFDLFRSLFGLPFLLGTVILVAAILFMLFGGWRIGYSQGVLAVALEIGPISWTRRLTCDRSARVSIRSAKWQKNNVSQQLIQVECQGNTLNFGSPIPDEQKAFIAEALRRSLAEG